MNYIVDNLLLCTLLGKRPSKFLSCENTLGSSLSPNNTFFRNIDHGLMNIVPTLLWKNVSNLGIISFSSNSNYTTTYVYTYIVIFFYHCQDLVPIPIGVRK